MPKDYSNGKIYQMEPICDHEEGDVYIGSSCQKFISRRLAEHIYDYKKWKNGKRRFVSSYSLFEKYGIDNVRIVLLESCPCTSNDELRAREAYYQKSMKCINTNIAFTTKQEKIEQIKQYIIEHREEILEQQKQYNIEHKEEILEYKKQYYQNKKQELLEKAKEKIVCECGREIVTISLKRHQRSDIHKELMTKIV